jgi:prepilin-type N-terminal cleavage/methylation domain-containing protein
MKTSRFNSKSARTAGGFTLIELLLVMTIIALLAALTLGAFTYAQQAASRNRTTAALAAIKAGLEQYKEKFGEYPEPADKEGTVSAGGGTFKAGGAKMLYQAISGDGSDEIELPGKTTTASDGKVDTDEIPNSINGNLPKTMILKSSEGYLLIDGFGRPFQYVKPTGTEQAVNATYDLWSFGTADVKSGAPDTSYDSRKEGKNTASWIKNW